MIKHNILFIGIDTHKEFVEVAYIEDHYSVQRYIMVAFLVQKRASPSALGVTRKHSKYSKRRITSILR